MHKINCTLSFTGSSLCNVPPKLAKREQPHSSTKREDTGMLTT